jgi:tubulin polyglutamylase TTLL5
MQAKYGKAYHFMPKSHVLPSEIYLFMHAHEQRKADKKWYIIKPTASSQGRGIFITNDIDEVTFFLSPQIDPQKK